MTETASLMGSLRWMAREMFSSPDQTVGVTMETDVWAFGMTLLVRSLQSIHPGVVFTHSHSTLGALQLENPLS